jgi:ferredoxin
VNRHHVEVHLATARVNPARGEGLPNVEATDWMAKAACLNVDPEVFFPSKGQSTAEARSHCRTCPVVAECRAYALDIGASLYGVWGNTSEYQRLQMRSDTAPRTCRVCGDRFLPHHHAAKHCSEACADESLRRKHARYEQKRRIA